MFQFIFFLFLFMFGFNACLCFEDAWNSFENTYNDANREELVVTNVTTDEHSKLDFSVRKWTSLSLGPICYSVGIMDTKIVLLLSTLSNDRMKFDIRSKVKDLEKTPFDAVLLKVRKNGQTEIFVIVAFLEELYIQCYKIFEEDMMLFGFLSLQNPVVHINAYRIERKNILLVADNSSLISLYEYDVAGNHMRFLPFQSLYSSSPIKSSALNNFELNHYLSIPQKSLGILTIYKLENNRFEHYKNLTNKNVNYVASFEIGFKSFLAVDGINPGIFQFNKNGVAREAITNSNLDGIVYWLPVPVTTYRDEVILFAQRVLHHGAHDSIVLEIFTYNGGKFEEHEDTPCSYFGELSSSLDCLMYRNGIIGASYVSVDDKLSLLVPGTYNDTLIFYLYKAIRQIQNPKEIEIKWLEKKQKEIEKAIEELRKQYEYLKNRNVESFSQRVQSDNMKNKLRKIDILGSRVKKEDVLQLNKELEKIGPEIEEVKERMNKIMERERRTEFNNIIINGTLEIEGRGKFGDVQVEKIKGVPATELLEDIVRKDSLKKISGLKTFTDLEVDKISFQRVNNIYASDIVTKDDTVISLNGDITFTNSLNAKNIDVGTGKVNNISLEEIIDVRDKYDGTLNFTTVKTKHLQADKINSLDMLLNKSHVPNLPADVDFEEELDIINIPFNMSVVNINGQNFNNLLKQLCLVDVGCYVSGHVNINGNITVKSHTVTQYLNNLSFPQEFIFKDSGHHSNITGKKTFEGCLTGKDIRSRGKINDLDTKKLVTLSTNQSIPGKMVFKDIEVTETLNVSGKVLGEHIDKFLPKPTLQNVSHISSNVNFKNLEVEGKIIVDNNLNGDNLTKLLRDIVYKDEDNVNIIAQKDFLDGLTVKENLQIESNSINTFDLDSIVTKDTDQVLDLTFLKGDIIFENLSINGTYGGFDIDQMDQEVVKLTGEQYISSTLIFNEDLEAENFEITEILNDLSADDYLYTDGDRQIDNSLEFESIDVEDLVVEGNVNVNISNVNLEGLGESYLSYTKEQTIEVPYSIRRSEVDNLDAEYINDHEYNAVFNKHNFSSKMAHLLEIGHFKIENLYVNGSVDIETVNDEKMNNMLPKNILLDESGNIRKNFSIQGNIFVDTLDIEKLSNVNWKDYVQQLVYKDEFDPVFESSKINFAQGIKVKKLIETQTLNGIPIERILTKEGAQDIKGSVTIKGDVTFKESVDVGEEFNEEPITSILEDFSVENGTYTVFGDVLFTRLPHVFNMTVSGFVSGKEAENHLSHVVFTDTNYILQGETTFWKTVSISGNMAIVKKLNNISISELVPNIVMTTNDADISGLVVFTKPVFVLKHVDVWNLDTNTLYGADLEEWKENSIFLDKGLVNGNYTFEDIFIRGDLTTTFINDLAMDSVIPLRSDQTIDYLEFQELMIVNSIPVGSLVNGYNLGDEYDKSMMTDLDQEIISNMVFKNTVLIRGNLSAAFINDKEALKIVSTNTDQNLTAMFNFTAKCRMESDLQVHGLIDGINTALWINKGLKIYSPYVQEIYDDFTVSNISFNENVEGQCVVNGLNLVQVMNEVEQKKSHKYKIEHGIIDDYKNMCIDVTYLYQLAKKQIYKFQYFEKLQTLSFPENIQHTFYFQHRDSHYLLVNQYNFTSQLFIFNSTAFNPIGSVDTGHISQIITAREKDNLYLITRSGNNSKECKMGETNVWKFSQENLMMENSLEAQDVLQESVVPGTFYGLNNEGVTEFRIIKDTGVQKIRRWRIYNENAAFVPRGLKTGLALRTGKKVIFLDRTDPVEEEEFSISTESVTIGNYTEMYNHFIPGLGEGDLVVTNVGTESAKRTLLAVATHEQTSVRGRLDFIKIYEDSLKGKIFHTVPAYKPSSLLSVEFDQGETLLVFMENEGTLQVYEYKGIEGFKHRSSAKIRGSSLFLMTLPIEPYLNPRKALGIVQENTVHIIQSVMLGNKIADDLKCEL